MIPGCPDLSLTSSVVECFWRLELAELWVPGQPVHLNEAYINRAKQLDRDLETALIEELDEARPKVQAAE